MASILSQLRQGKPTCGLVDIRGIRVAVVIQPSDVVRQIDEEIQEYASEHPQRFNESVKSHMYDQKLCYHCLRDPDNLSVRIADNEKEISQLLDQEDISRVTAKYGELIVNKAPKIELLGEEGLDEIKKFLEVTPLSDLNTVSLVHLANFLQTIRS